MLTSVVLHDVSFAWPDGALALDHVSGSFGVGRTGLVGANGAGKTTLLRLVTGELAPTGGAITSSGLVDYLPQRVTIPAAAPAAPAGPTVADLLGIAPALAALGRVEAGSTDPADFDAIGADWDVAERAVAELAAVGLPTGLARAVTTLSGGEVMLTAITGIRLRRAPIALLDEPTNNLDTDARGRLYGIVRSWRGTLIVVSHDRALLELMDATAELRGGALTTFGGPYSAYQAYVEAEQEAARQVLRTASQQLRRERQERIKMEERIAHSERKGHKDAVNRTFTPAAIDGRRNSAEKSQNSRRTAAELRVADARAAVQAAETLVRDDDTIRVDLPDPRVPRGRVLATLPSGDGRSFVLQGPQRLGLVGANGVGKTTLLRALLPTVRVRVGYLPQRITLDDESTVLDVVRAAAPALAPEEVRNRLARLLIRGTMVGRLVGTLSGGERFRVALARVLLADPPPELLVLDEPTNDLDLVSLDQLVEALSSYRGGLLVVSHDRDFLARLGLSVVLHLHPDGRLLPLTA